MQPTSVIARDKHEASGNASTNRQRVLWLVENNEGSTSRELFHRSKMEFGDIMDLTEVRRRLTDLAKSKEIHTGPQRYCRIRGNLQLTWFYGRNPNEEESARQQAQAAMPNAESLANLVEASPPITEWDSEATE